MDYILFARADVAMEPNPDEVQAVRYVDAATLRAMMAPESGLRWSPWFRRAPGSCPGHPCLWALLHWCYLVNLAS